MKKVLSLALFLSLTVFTGQAITIRIIPSFGPPQNAASFFGYTTGAVNLIKNTSMLPAGERMSPNDARLIQYVVLENLMTTTSLPFYLGIFSPTAPWNNERGGTVWWWIEVTASEGETISLADVSVVLSSSDANNILGKTVSYSGPGIAYSPTSPGIQIDGSEIISGPANQQVKRVIVGAGSRSFSVNSSEGAQAVKNFLNQFANWRMISTVIAKGATNTCVLLRKPPVLRAMRLGNRFLVITESNGDPTNYELLQTSTLGVTAVWTYGGIIRSGQTNDAGSIQDHPVSFIRYAPF
jgi:hypothetical protein